MSFTYTREERRTSAPARQPRGGCHASSAAETERAVPGIWLPPAMNCVGTAQGVALHVAKASRYWASSQVCATWNCHARAIVALQASSTPRLRVAPALVNVLRPPTLVCVTISLFVEVWNKAAFHSLRNAPACSGDRPLMPSSRLLLREGRSAKLRPALPSGR